MNKNKYILDTILNSAIFKDIATEEEIINTLIENFDEPLFRNAFSQEFDFLLK